VPREPSAVLFPTDRPLPADLLIGRGEDVREIAATLAGGGHLVISGPRRTGKTSVCDAALRKLEDDGLYVVEVDLFRIASAAELAEALVARTIANRSALRRVVHQAREAGRLVADAAGVSAVVKSKTELSEEIEIAFTPSLAHRDPERYLDYALALPGRIAAADGRRAVVFFDEFQEIAGSRAPYRDLPRNSVRRALEELRGIGSARSEGRGKWRITDPLLGRYLAELDPLG
jgi:AAA+ ATPase superfamily predicted ATPase